MARYDRDFLVTYLEDVFALHMAQRYIHHEAQESKRDAEVYRGKMNPKSPELEKVIHVSTAGNVLSGTAKVFYIITFATAFTMMLCGMPGAAVVIGILAGICALISKGWGWITSGMKSIESEIEERNRMKMEVWQDAVEDAPLYKEPYEKALERGKMLEEEKLRIESVLNKVYSANVIPFRYRNEYAVTYLYEWFSTSGADDLDAALNMYVLEDIKSRLDTIIRNQQAMILNQRVMIANQERAREQAERHYVHMMEKLNNIEASNEERNRYLRMIDANVETVTYFATVDYLQH